MNEAFRYAKAAVRNAPEHPDAHFLLGRLYYLRQDLRRARDSWRRALKLAPSRQDIRTQLEKLKREMKVEKSLTRSDTHPFVVRFAERETPVDMGGLRRMLRDTHRKIGQQFQYFPDHRITILLYPEADFEKVKGVSHRVAGLYDGKIRLPMRPGKMDSRELKRILWHEYTHALVHDLSKGRCPVWLNEGIATGQEARIHRIDLRVAKAAFKQKAIPSWGQLWRGSYEARTMELNYQVSYLLVNYLVKRWSWSRLVKLLKRLGQGYPIEDAIQKTYRRAPKVIEREWMRWLGNKL